MRKLTFLSVAIVCGLLAAGGVAVATNGSEASPPGFAQQPLAGEHPVKLEALPAWVLHTAKVALPAATFAQGQLDQDEIGAVYEIKGTYKDAPAEVDVFPDGKLEEIELVIKTEDVPEAPLKLFDKHFPKFTLTKIEKSIRTRGAACSRSGTSGTARQRTAPRSTWKSTAAARSTSTSPTEQHSPARPTEPLGATCRGLPGSTPASLG